MCALHASCIFIVYVTITWSVSIPFLSIQILRYLHYYYDYYDYYDSVGRFSFFGNIIRYTTKFCVYVYVCAISQRNNEKFSLSLYIVLFIYILITTWCILKNHRNLNIWKITIWSKRRARDLRISTS